jgi:hypothetical protein
LCLTHSGQLQASSIDLNNHIGIDIDEAKFVLGGSGLKDCVRDLRLEKKGGKFYMYGTIQKSKHLLVEAIEQVNLSFALLNKNGNLVWEPR